MLDINVHWCNMCNYYTTMLLRSCTHVHMYCNILQWCSDMMYMCCATIVHVRSCCSIMHMLRYNVTMLRWQQHMCNHVASCCIMWQLSEFTCTLGMPWCNMHNSPHNMLHWGLHMLDNVTTLSQCKITCCSMMYDWISMRTYIITCCPIMSKCISIRTYIITCCMLCCRRSTTLQHVRWCRTC